MPPCWSSTSMKWSASLLPQECASDCSSCEVSCSISQKICLQSNKNAESKFNTSYSISQEINFRSAKSARVNSTHEDCPLDGNSDSTENPVCHNCKDLKTRRKHDSHTTKCRKKWFMIPAANAPGVLPRSEAAGVAPMPGVLPPRDR